MANKIWKSDFNGRTLYVFHCPACGFGHPFFTARPAGDNGPIWTFNGDMERPTFSPSLLILPPAKRCHLFVRDGKIEYCGDCDHEYAGKVIDMPDALIRA